MSKKQSVVYVKREKSMWSKLVDQIDRYSIFNKEITTIAEQARKKLEIEQIASQRELDNAKLKKANKLTLDNLLAQSGLSLTIGQFYGLSILSAGLFFVLGAFVMKLGALLGLVFAVFGALVFPRWVLQYKRAKRFKAFMNSLPIALESIVRNLKSGIPMNEAMKILASEAKEPIKTEFSILIQEQQMGLTIGHAFERLAIRIPIEETRFLAIAIEIQAKSGGNLTEVLSKLAQVLRDRRRLKLKIKSMTSEARAGAYIIGGIPFAILGALSIVEPNHVNFFFEDPTGIVIIVGCVVWQAIGVFVMYKMTNFKI